MKEEKCNWRGIGTLMVITVCLVSVMSPAMTQSSFPLFGNISNGTNGETGDESIPTSTPTLTPTLTPSPTPTPSLTPIPDPTPSPSPAPTPTPTPTHSPTPTSDPTPTLTSAPTPTPFPVPITPPTIVSFAPPSPVSDVECATRTFNITTDQAVNVSWLLNGTVVQTNESVTEASYTNTNLAVGTWNVSAVATNENGTEMQTWIWNVSSTAPTPTPGPTPSPSPITTPSPTPAPIQSLESNITPSTPFFIYGYVSYKNGDKCNNPVVNITINANMSWQAETSNNSNYFQLVVTNISKEDVLEFNATDGVGYNTTNRTIVQEDINKGVIDFNLTLPVLAPIINNITIADDDLTVPGVQVINLDPSTNKTVTITANVTDLSGEDLVNISVIANITGPSEVKDSPVSLAFVSNITVTAAIYNGTFNMSNHSAGNYTVEVNATNADGLTHTLSKNFTYLSGHGPDLTVTSSIPSCLLANKSFTIPATICNNGTVDADAFNVTFYVNGSEETATEVSNLSFETCTDVNFSWRPTQLGMYNITVFADSSNVIPEINETNNNWTKQVGVGKLDFFVGPITFNTTELLVDYPVLINATIVNNGTPGWNVTVGFYVDNKSLANKSVYVNNDSENYAEAVWIAAYGEHNITVKVDTGKAVEELNESNNENSTSILINASRDFVVADMHMSINGTELDINDTIWDSDTVNINATILNNGTKEGNCTVEFWDMKNVSIERIYVDYQNFSPRGTDVIVQPNASEIRVHFSYIYVKGAGSYVNVCGNNLSTDSYVINEWVDCSGDTIWIKSNASDDWNACVLFEIDKYEALLETRTKTVFDGKNETFTANWTATTGNHTIVVRADPDDEIAELNETNNQAEAEEVYVSPSRDFKVANISFYPRAPFVTISATIENLGNRSGTVTVDFYLDNNTEPFAANETRVSANGTNYTEVVWEEVEVIGWHTITVIADPLDIISEIDETNNKNETRIFVNAVDFAVRNINVAEALFGEKVEINATIENRGDKNGTTDVEFYDTQNISITGTLGEWNEPCNDTITLPGVEGIKIHFETFEETAPGHYSYIKIYNKNNSEVHLAENNWTEWAYGDTIRIESLFSEFTIDKYQALLLRTETVSLDSNKSKTVNASWNATPLGWHTIAVVVDPDNAVIEWNGSNNEMSMPILVNGTDLAVGSIDVNLGEVYYDEKRVNVTLKANISNSGAMDASNFSVTFRNDSSLIRCFNYSNLSSGETIQVNTTWNATFTTHHIAVEIEPGNNPESNLTNNNKSIIKDILPDVDFTVTAIECVPPVNAKEDEDLYILATIGNAVNRSGGDSGSDRAKIEVAVAFYVDDILINTTAVDVNISVSGGNYTSVAIWDATLDINHLTEEHEIKVVVDPAKRIIEFNESNNELNKSITLKLSDLTITNISLKHTPVFGKPVNVIARIKNNGDEHANTTAWFYDENEIDHPVRLTIESKGSVTEYINHSNASKIKIHFNKFVSNYHLGDRLEIYDQDDKLIETISSSLHTGGTTSWISGDSVKIVLYRDLTSTQAVEAEAVVDKYFALFENKSVSVGANDTDNFTVVWNTTTPGLHNLWVQTSTGENSTDVFVNGTDLAVTNFSLDAEYDKILGYKVIGGKEVAVNATIENLGAIDAGIFNVTFYNDSTPFYNETYPSLEAGKSIPLNITWNAAPIGMRDIKVEIDPMRNPEHNITNNIETARGWVSTPWDFAVTGIKFEPKELEEGEDVNITATIKNFRVGNGSDLVNVSFYVDGFIVTEEMDVVDITGTLIGTREVEVNAGEENRTEVEWKNVKPVMNHLRLSADHEIIVWVDPHNQKYEEEISETNNIKREWLHINNESLEIIGNVTLGPENPVYDELVNISATVKNRGSKDKNISATAWFYFEKEIVLEDSISGGKVGYSRNGMLKQPGARMMRVHFSDFSIDEKGYIRIRDENEKLVHDLSNESEHLKLRDGNWTDWVPGNFTTIEYYAPPKGWIDFSIDKFQALIGNKTNEIAYGNETQFTINWTASPTVIGTDEEIGNCTIGVWAVGTTKIRPTYVHATDLAVEFDLNNTHTYLDGEKVHIINASIKNQGLKNASNFTVKFWEIYYPEDGPSNVRECDHIYKPLNETHIENLTAGESLNLTPVEWNASIVPNLECTGKCGSSYDFCSWYETAYNYTIKVEIETLDNKFDNESNDDMPKEVRVNPSRDFTVTDIRWSNLKVSENATLNATIENLGVMGGEINVSFYLDDDTNAFNTIRKFVNANETTNGTNYAEIVWPVTVGDGHNITVKADPENEIIEKDEKNNIRTERIWVNASDLTITNISFGFDKEELVVEGDVVNITAKVENIGERNATNVTVRFEIEGPFFSPKKKLEELSGEIIPSLNVSNYSYVNVSWSTEYAGVYNITVIADPDGKIPEIDEYNNSMNETLIVQGPDLTVSSMRLTWLNNSEINGTRTIKHGEWVKINALVSNIGKLPANNFDVSLRDNEHTEFTPLNSLEPGESKPVPPPGAVRRATVGNHTFEVVADHGEMIAETNETNNSISITRYVCGAELSGNISWVCAEFLENKNTSWERRQPLDLDVVNITATVTNSGCIKTGNFNTTLELKYEDTDTGEIIKEEKKKLSLDVNETANISIMQNVSTGNYNITLRIDREGKVPEDEKYRKDNTIRREMRVNASRDFVVMNVTAEKTSLSDFDTTNITAAVANVGFRNGTTEVSIIDYENESRAYNYWFNENELHSPLPHYAPVPTTTSGDWKMQIIRRPGVDAIQIHFDEVKVSYDKTTGLRGSVWICDGRGIEVWYRVHTESGVKGSQDDEGNLDDNPWIPGDTAYIYSAGRADADFEISGYTTRKELKREEVSLNASMNETKNIPVEEWIASTGEHIINVTADLDNEIGELNESNNAFELPLHVNASRDPAIVELSNTPLCPRDGDNVRITAKVCNNGTKEAKFTVDLWQYTIEDCTVDDEFESENIFVPGASWVSVHLKNIKIGRWGGEEIMENVWVSSIGDMLKVAHHEPVDNPKFDWWMVGGIQTCSPTNPFSAPLSTGNWYGGYVTSDSEWYEQVDKIRYMRLLKREYVSLAPGESSTVSATWYNIDFSVNTTHTVIAIVDAEDEIDEINEGNSDNERSRVLTLGYPDLTVIKDEIGYDRVTKNATVTINNTGYDIAENVTVLFAREEELEHPIVSKGGTSSCRISKEGADVIKVHVEYLKKGSLHIVGNKYDKKDDNGFWSDWVDAYEGSIGLWWEGATFKIDKYKYGIFLEENIDVIRAGEPENVSIPWSEYEPPYELTVEVDPEIDTTDDITGVILESNEWNNEETFQMGADIKVEVNVGFGGNVHPYAPITDYTENCSIKAIKNIGNLPTNEFEAELEVTNVIGPPYHFPDTKTISSLAPGEEYTLFWPVPKELPEERVYNIAVIADREDNTVELDETNNEDLYEVNNNITVYNYTDYGGKDLEFYTSGSVYGGFNYTIGDSDYEGIEKRYTDRYYEVHFEDVYPKGATPVLARLYLYWTWSYNGSAPSPPRSKVSEPAPIDVSLNVGSLEKEFVETPHASDYDVAWGAYAYNISSPSTSVRVNVTKEYPTWVHYHYDEMDDTWIPYDVYTFALFGAGLLVVYEDLEEGVWTNYWITEGADVIYEGANDLEEKDLITTANFPGTVEKITYSNATLWTVVPGGNDKAALEFNKERWGGNETGDVWSFDKTKSLYPAAGSNIQIGIDNRYVTEPLQSGGNTAKFCYIEGGSMMPTNAFLIVRYPPDLVPSVKTPLTATVGQEYDVPVFINNKGLSKAKGFNASVYVEGELEKTVNDTEIAGGGRNDELTFTRTAPYIEDVISFNVTVVVDPEDNVKELINEQHPDGETNNNQTWPVIVSVGPPSWEPGPGVGGGGGKGTGWGTGTGPGEGAGASGVTAGGTGEAAVGEFKGEAITGYLMKGTVAQSGAEGGGGGRGEFSLVALLLRLAILAAAGALVCVGYLMERRRQKINSEN